ncbi:uncharacterized protein LOC132737114 isoform X2 [Ruditapes philippinarum]|uniref:uncharacterized protein LOC132737114 isoform X2 n=1 Tax=Ruditapes philippinarum TaxID=129788 RepID=UPI00295B387C|nr:uncharacterized protein LOC132737114 isoform X2 [Ruditapes philippinarum]
MTKCDTKCSQISENTENTNLKNVSLPEIDKHKHCSVKSTLTSEHSNTNEQNTLYKKIPEITITPPELSPTPTITETNAQRDLGQKLGQECSRNEGQNVYRANIVEQSTSKCTPLSLKFKVTDSNHIESKVLQQNNVDIKTPQSLGQEKENIVSDIGEKNKTSCYYVKTAIGQIKGGMLIDSGSPVSIISTKCYYRLENKPRLELVKMPLSTANGVRLKIAGKCMINFEIEHLVFCFEFIVADIEETIGILGIDFFENYNVSLKVHKRLLKTSMGKVRVYNFNSRMCAKVQITDISHENKPLLHSYNQDNLNKLSATRKYWFIDKIDNGKMILQYAFDKNQSKSFETLDTNSVSIFQTYLYFERSKQLLIQSKIIMLELMSWIKRVKCYLKMTMSNQDLDLCMKWNVQKNTKFKSTRL